jgi:hypothetical protein
MPSYTDAHKSCNFYFFEKNLRILKRQCHESSKRVFNIVVVQRRHWVATSLEIIIPTTLFMALVALRVEGHFPPFH